MPRGIPGSGKARKVRRVRQMNGLTTATELRSLATRKLDDLAYTIMRARKEQKLWRTIHRRAEKLEQ